MEYKRSVQHNQHLCDQMFKNLLWCTVCVYIDDILIYSNSFNEHIQDLDEVMQILSNKGFTIKAKKAFIGYQSIKVLGHQVDRFRLSSTAEKMEAIRKLEFPANLKDLDSVIGLTSWNCHLIPFLAYWMAPLQKLKMELLNKQETRDQRAQYIQRTTLEPSEKEVNSFKDVKEALIDSVHNYHFVKGRPLFIFLDASKAWGFGAAVYQSIATDGSTCRKDLCLICFVSRQIMGAESHYWPMDLKLAGLIWAVKKLRINIEKMHTMKYTDQHSNASIYAANSLKTTSPGKLNLHQQSWANYLSQFKDGMMVTYKAGSLMTVPDALLRLKARLETEIEATKTSSTEENETTNVFALTFVELEEDLSRSILEGISLEPRMERIRQTLKDSAQDPIPERITKHGIPYILDTAMDHLYYIDLMDACERLVIPPGPFQKELLTLAHGTTHQGIPRMYHKVAPGFFWKGL